MYIYRKIEKERNRISVDKCVVKKKERVCLLLVESHQLVVQDDVSLDAVLSDDGVSGATAAAAVAGDRHSNGLLYHVDALVAVHVRSVGRV